MVEEEAVILVDGVVVVAQGVEDQEATEVAVAQGAEDQAGEGVVGAKKK